MRRHEVAFALPLYRNATTPAIGVELHESLFGKGSGGLNPRNTPAASRLLSDAPEPGFIRFSLLANGLAETFCLADVNPEAVEACQRNRGSAAETFRPMIEASGLTTVLFPSAGRSGRLTTGLFH